LEDEKMRKMAMVLVCIVFASTASATLLGTADLENHGNGFSDQGQLWGAGLAGGTYYTGIYSWVNMGGTGLGTQVPNWGFCIELPQSPVSGWQNVIPLDEAPLPAQFGTPMGMTKADAIRELWGKHFDPSWPTGANTQMAEAFSACIWEIIYETEATWDVTSGAGFRSTIEQAVTANSWLAGLDGTGLVYNLVATSNDGGQDFVVQVPEPATMLILGLGALGLLHRKHSKA
jgi:hypothetical protein